MSERLHLIRLGDRGLNIYELAHWWDVPTEGVLTLVLNNKECVTVTGSEREALRHWLAEVSFTITA